MLPIMGTFAQTFSEPCIPTKEYTKSIDASVTMGTTGVGVDVAVPIGDVVKVRTGFTWMPRFHATMNFGVKVGDKEESQDTAMLHFASHTGLSPSMVTFSKVFCSRFAYNVAVLQPQPRLATPLVWAVPRSLATTGGIIHLFSLPAGTKMFQFPALALNLED